jgi:hypothetical protein
MQANIFEENEAGFMKTKVSISESDFSSKEAYDAFCNSENGWKWHYNSSTGQWGYDSDPMNWSQKNEDYIDNAEIEDIFLSDDKKEAEIILKQGSKAESEAKKVDKAHFLPIYDSGEIVAFAPLDEVSYSDTYGGARIADEWKVGEIEVDEEVLPVMNDGSEEYAVLDNPDYPTRKAK